MNGLRMTYDPRTTPARPDLAAQHLQGRVAAAANMFFSVPQTASIAVGAVLITLIDFRVEIVIMAVVTLIAAGYLATRRGDAPVTEAALA